VKYNKEQQAQVNELNYRIGELNTASADIVAMEKDENYTFKLNAIDGAIAEVTPTADDVKNKVYTLNYINGDVGNQIHEVAKHGSQILNGDLIYSADASGKVNASVRAGITHFDLEVSAYKAQYSYGGVLEGYREPVAGSPMATANTLGGFTNTPDQINSPFRVTNHSEINVGLVRSMMEAAIGNKKLY
jgi:hypothetical protein